MTTQSESFLPNAISCLHSFSRGFGCSLINFNISFTTALSEACGRTRRDPSRSTTGKQFALFSTLISSLRLRLYLKYLALRCLSWTMTSLVWGTPPTVPWTTGLSTQRRSNAAFQSSWMISQRSGWSLWSGFSPRWSISIQMFIVHILNGF